MPGIKAPEVERREQIVRAAYRVAAERGLTRLTIREVASVARLSSGLVLFHFETREDLLIELLDWLLATTADLQLSAGVAEKPPIERLCAVVTREIRRFSEDPARIRLLFEYWVLGMRNPEIQTRMRRDLHRYRDAFLPLTADAIAVDPARFASVTPEGLAAVAVSFIKGCGIQTVIDLDHTDSHELRDAAARLLGLLTQAAVAHAPTPDQLIGPAAGGSAAALPTDEAGVASPSTASVRRPSRRGGKRAS